MENRYESRGESRGDSRGGDRGGDRGGSRSDGPGGRGARPRGKFFKGPRRKQCRFCTEENMTIDYKNVSMLRQFLTERAKIVPRRTTGNCAKHQRQMTEAVKRARVLALVPFTVE
ncbi:MAG: 30S ribosomal protein S18 [Candidatus Firestonebacteria bacterium RIFOXYC2_FULL_39_67]|nr:MAG: 30S ribosomal protein S18 [Candidatus Firestonebacteria bacterium RIFOXYD2_FULL_39_29]OGF56201.1 MAG: 30S ribosomal protein S18 [Candidatus Firestonebacteria bacterium RIFOXYC2_FULL_39_67]OGF57280.1 MAG: 30S ribosomal protein S18 [Candidatus Firestonebacteria bacterium RifOxyC12_full_39_7]